MTNVEVKPELVKKELEAKNLIDSCEQYLLKEERKESTTNEFAKMPLDIPNDNNTGTLPKAMKKNISRSLVPRMRRMFERARSCEPSDLQQASSVRLIRDSKRSNSKRSLTPNTFLPLSPSSSVVSAELEQQKSDGTESVSSFVALDGPTTLESNSESETENSNPNLQAKEDKNKNTRKSTDNNNSFVNKCVSKVKNIIHGDGVVHNNSKHKE